MKRFLLLGLILVAGLIGLSSCTEVVRPLEGTWTVDSTETIAGDRVLGDGTITLSYVGALGGWEVYSGSGSFTGGIFDYVAEALYIPGFVLAIELSEDGDTDDDYIGLDDNTYSGGNTMSGAYTGWGEYSSATTTGRDIGSGSFTATR